MQYIAGQRRPVLVRTRGRWTTGRLAGWVRDHQGWTAHVWVPTGPPVWSSTFHQLPATAVRDAEPCEACPAAHRQLQS